MATNPLVALGYLNKLLASVQVISTSDLNVSSSFLGDDGIDLALEGNAGELLPVMTGLVPSPNPMQRATVRVNMLRTQSLSAAWRAQIESNVMIGNIIVTPDAVTLPPYPFYNCMIMGVAELAFAGKTPMFQVTIGGTYYINSSLYD